MFAIKFYSGSKKLEIQDINEYTLRRTCIHVPLTNVWQLIEFPGQFYITFPRYKTDNPKDKLSMEEKLIDAQTIMYEDKKKLESLQKKDTAYKWKEN